MTTGNITTGKTVLKEFLDKAGINSASMSIADGSGLSRYNLITPMQIITLLRYMDQQSYGTEFYESLPIAGDDGTLKYRMIGTKAEKNVYAKTGTLANVRCLSGYIFTGDGEKLAISMLVNNFLVPVSVSTRIQDLVCERLANFTRKL